MKHFAIQIGDLKVGITGIDHCWLDSLPQCNAAKSPQDAFAQIVFDQDMDLSGFKPKSTDSCQTFQLKALTYEFNSEQQTYAIYKQGVIIGAIDFTANTVLWNRARLSEARSFFHLHILDPLSLVIPQQNSLICHASAISTTEGVVLILGDSGAGKSTLAILLSQEFDTVCKGILSDDTVMISLKDDDVFVSPIKSGFGISKQLIEKYRFIDTQSNLVKQSGKKQYLKTIKNETFTDGRLDKIIFLERDTKTNCLQEITHLDSSQALRQFINNHTQLAHPLTERHLSNCAAIVNNAKCFKITYKEYCSHQTIFNLINHQNRRA